MLNQTLLLKTSVRLGMGNTDTALQVFRVAYFLGLSGNEMLCAALLPRVYLEVSFKEMYVSYTVLKVTLLLFFLMPLFWGKCDQIFLSYYCDM